jgi:hypothetical protein
MAAKPLTLQRLSNVELEEISGWASLAVQDQKSVKDQTQLLFDSIQDAGKARLRIGQHLVKVRDILEPKRMFNNYLLGLNFSRATAYRMIEDYEKSRTILPPPFMQVAILRGNQTLKAETIKALPPPKTASPVLINEYFDKAEKYQRTQRAKRSETDPETLKKIIVNQVRLQYDKLPDDDTRFNRAWLRSIAGMVLTIGGISEEISIVPQKIPKDFFVPVGRPSGKKAKKA